MFGKKSTFDERSKVMEIKYGDGFVLNSVYRGYLFSCQLRIRAVRIPLRGELGSGDFFAGLKLAHFYRRYFCY